MFAIARDGSDLEDLVWPAPRLGEAIEFLARKGGLLPQPLAAPLAPAHLEQADAATLERWVEVASAQLRLEAEPVETPHVEVEQLVRQAGPAILRLPASPQHPPLFLALLKGGRRRVSIAGPDFVVHRVRPRAVRDAMCRELESPWLEMTQQLLSEVGVAPERQARAQKVILNEQLGSTRIKGGWLLRLSPGANLRLQVRRARLLRPLLTIAGAHIVQQLLVALSWVVIGRGALQGHFEWGWLGAWALILFTVIPLQLLTTWARGQFAIGAGGIFKQRLLYGTLQLDPEEIRYQGAGQFLGRVMEADAVEALALGGGLAALMSVTELLMATVILALGAGGLLHSLLLALWVIGALVLSWRYWRQSRSWIDAYRDMTNNLVEQMVGHRTRLAQQEREHWHDEEDQALGRYLKLSENLDRIGVQLNALVLRGWLVLGLAGLARTFVTTPDSPAKLAIGLGGILLALQALTNLVTGVQSVVGAMLAWNQVAPLFQAATRSTDSQVQDVLALATSTPAKQSSPQDQQGQTVLVARDLVFRYHEHGPPVLRECSLHIRQGERLLLQGPSGGGKSTLAALLTSLRAPESGLLLLRGFDQQTIGADEWRRRVVMAPQFHENHILTGTMAFNLLLGRRWPPLPEDVREAAALCRQLGLGDLLDRMPSGMQQVIGERGWQLSHSECSRIFIARAILQRADLIILDESFGALDPENLRRALNCVLDQATTLLVIAHP